MKIHTQKTAYSSPWPLRTKLLRFIFIFAWYSLCRWNPKSFSDWRNFILRLFGATLVGRPYVSPSAIIHFPYNLSMGPRACLGPRVHVYNLAKVTIGEAATVSMDAMLLCGSHDFESEKRELTTSPIRIEEDVFIGARAILLPGSHVQARCLVGAGAVFSGTTDTAAVYVGNPARRVRTRDGFRFDLAQRGDV